MARPLRVADCPHDQIFSEDCRICTPPEARPIDFDDARPTRWLWDSRIPIGSISLLIGAEGVGKGVFLSHLMASLGRGEFGATTSTLLIGDEDDAREVWSPRLVAAGAPPGCVYTANSDEFSDVTQDAVIRDLGDLVAKTRSGFIVFDQILDNVNVSGTEAREHRQALQPLRRAARAWEVAVLCVLHPPKGQAKSFRDLVAVSHQYNAVSRSSLLLAYDPRDWSRRVVVRGKGNLSDHPPSLEFAIEGHEHDLSGYSFDTPRVVDAREGNLTAEDLLKSGRASRRADGPSESEQRILDALDAGPMRRSELIEELGFTKQRLSQLVNRMLEKGLLMQGSGGVLGRVEP
jgi:hypothetical protein